MSRTFLMAFGIGIACIAIAVGAIFYMQRGARVESQAKVLKVRTAALDERSSLAVLDFRFTNTSDYPFMVRTVTLVNEGRDGSSEEGQTVSETDAKHVFEVMPLLGPKYNVSMIMRDRIPAHATWDRMIASRFEVPEDQLQARKRFVLRIEEVDGQTIDIPEK